MTLKLELVVDVIIVRCLINARTEPAWQAIPKTLHRPPRSDLQPSQKPETFYGIVHSLSLSACMTWQPGFLWHCLFEMDASIFHTQVAAGGAS